MIVVVTGASRGIGRAIANAFAAEGNTVLICARDKEKLQKAVAEMAREYKTASVHGFVADLVVKNDALSFANWCLGFASPDVLVNNAGKYVPGNVIDDTEGALEEMINTNLYSAWYVTRALAPAMIKTGRGHIFNVSSIAGIKAYEGGGAYSISKYALNGFNDNLRHELMPHGIKVTNVLPGAVMTDSWAGFDNTSSRIMEAADIAKMVVAASKLSEAATVETIVVRPQLGDL